jgi:hypothetical protein
VSKLKHWTAFGLAIDVLPSSTFTVLHAGLKQTAFLPLNKHPLPGRVLNGGVLVASSNAQSFRPSIVVFVVKSNNPLVVVVTDWVHRIRVVKRVPSC